MIHVPKKCEVLTPTPFGRERFEFCGAPAATAYPALGGGWMPLCESHGAKHAAYTLPINLIEAGQRHEMWDRKPDVR